MPSPFPGMDPYLEPHWLDVHTRLVTNASTALNRVLPPDLVARSEERLAIASDDPLDAVQRDGPDVTVFHPGSAETAAGGATLTAPYKLVVDLDPLTERSIKIIRPRDERVITVVEFLSPTNKSGEGLHHYVAKRNELVAGHVHVVEIDLVRTGDWRAVLRPHLCPREAVTPYRVTIRLGGHRDAVYLYPISLRTPLPQVPVPLRPGDPDIRLDLQQLITDAYADGRYAMTLDYSAPPDPPLAGSDADWAAALARPRPAS